MSCRECHLLSTLLVLIQRSGAMGAGKSEMKRLAIKAISDAYDFELASLGRFTTSRGQFRTAAFALHTALHPATWRSAAVLGRNSGRALRNLQERLQEVFAEWAGSASNPQ